MQYLAIHTLETRAFNIPSGERFDPEDVGLDSKEVERLLKTGAIRKPPQEKSNPVSRIERTNRTALPPTNLGGSRAAPLSDADDDEDKKDTASKKTPTRTPTVAKKSDNDSLLG